MDTIKQTPTSLVLLMGLPAAGKTSLVQVLRQQPWPWTTYVVHYDDFLPPIPTEWKQARQNILKCVENLLTRNQPLNSISNEILTTKLSSYNANSPRVVYLDDNFYFQSMRYEYYKLCRTYQWSFAVIHVHASEETAVERNKLRTNPVPERVIRDMFLKLELPTESWEQFSITLHTESDVNLKLVKSLVENSLNRPVLPLVDEAEVERLRAEARLECKANVLHVVDSVLRKTVSEMMKTQKTTLNSGELHDLALRLNDFRMKILNLLRSLKPPPEDPTAWAHAQFCSMVNSVSK